MGSREGRPNLNRLCRQSIKARTKASSTQEQLAQRMGTTQSVVAQHVIVRAGKKIKSSTTFNRGELVVNGQPMLVFQ